MALPKGYHIQMVITDSEGKLVNILPVTVGKEVKIDPTGNESVVNTITNVQELVDKLGSLAFLNEIPAASTSSSGVVTLSNAIDQKTAETTAATTAAVSTVAEVANSAVQNTGDEDVSGVKTFKDGVAFNGASITSETSESGTTVTVDFN